MLKNEQLVSDQLISNDLQEMLKEHLNIDIDIYDHFSESQKKSI